MSEYLLGKMIITQPLLMVQPRPQAFDGRIREHGASSSKSRKDSIGSDWTLQ